MALENSLKMRWSRGEKVERLHPKMSNTDNCEEKKKKKETAVSLFSCLTPSRSWIRSLQSRSAAG